MEIIGIIIVVTLLVWAFTYEEPVNIVLYIEEDCTPSDIQKAINSLRSDYGQNAQIELRFGQEGN